MWLCPLAWVLKAKSRASEHRGHTDRAGTWHLQPWFARFIRGYLALPASSCGVWPEMGTEGKPAALSHPLAAA